MIVCHFKMEEESNGNKLLTGMLGCAMQQGAIIILRKIKDEYCLVAASGDGRQINYSQQTLGSFMDTTVPCGWCIGKEPEHKNVAVFIVGHSQKYFLCADCAELSQFKKYKYRTKIGRESAPSEGLKVKQ